MKTRYLQKIWALERKAFVLMPVVGGPWYWTVDGLRFRAVAIKTREDTQRYQWSVTHSDSGKRICRVLFSAPATNPKMFEQAALREATAVFERATPTLARQRLEQADKLHEPFGLQIAEGEFVPYVEGGHAAV